MTWFETDRLTVRNFRADDGADLLAYLREPSARCFASLAVADLAAATVVATKRGAGDDYLAIVLKEGGAVIGDVFAIAEGTDGADRCDTFGVGWNLNPRFGRRGYAFEAAQGLFDHLFDAQRARRLYAYVDQGNDASEKLCWRLGMREEGLFLEFVSFGNDGNGAALYENTRQFAMLRREWLLRRSCGDPPYMAKTQ